MNVVFIAIAIVVVAVGGYFGSKNKATETKNEVLSLNTTESFPTNTPRVEPSATSSIKPPTSTATSVSTSNYSDWKYPNAKVESEGKVLVMSSNDDADKITNWYKDKVMSLGYSTRNSIKTSSNGVVKNLLQVVNKERSVSIEISKPHSDATVTIEVEITSF